MWQYTYSDELYHHGIKGQKWGVRRYQNPDGSLTNAGKKKIRSALKEQEAAKKYKARIDADRKWYKTYDDIFGDKPEGYEPTRKELDRMDKATGKYNKASYDFSDAMYKIKNDFIQKYGNKRVSDLKALSEKGKKEVKDLLEASKTDRKIWDENIDTVRRSNIDSDRYNLANSKYERDAYKELMKNYKSEYGETLPDHGNISKKKLDDNVKYYERMLKSDKKLSNTRK